jgi:hypothetical protein
MALPSDFLSALRAPSIDELIAEQRASTPEEETTHTHARGAYLSLENEIAPAELFCYLGARFGPPNGIQNILRGNHSDNIVHWDWSLKYDTVYVYFWGTNFRTDLIVGAGIEFGEHERKQLIELIKKDLKSYSPKMKEVRSLLQDWVEFVNPFWRLTRAIQVLNTELLAIDLKEPSRNEYYSPLDLSTRETEWKALTERFSRAFGLCFGIRAMLPVRAESFVNLLIFVLARQDIRSDRRLMENACKQHIDIRIKSLHITCTGFSTAVDYSSDICREFHTLINERNDLLHGNVLPDKMSFNEVYFLDKVPVFKEYKSVFERTLAVDIQAIGLRKIESELKIIDCFIDYVIKCLEPEIQNQMRMIMARRDLAKNKKTGRLGILFPEHLVDSRLVFESAEQHRNDTMGFPPEDS